jgi:hypothetical protein
MFRIPSFSITPTFSICSVHGYLNGEQKFCPKCDDVLRQVLILERGGGDGDAGGVAATGGCTGGSTMARGCGAAEAMEAIVLPEERRQKCEVWTRVMGYLRPVDSYNKGKKSEYAERLMFREAKCFEAAMDAADCNVVVGKVTIEGEITVSDVSEQLRGKLLKEHCKYNRPIDGEADSGLHNGTKENTGVMPKISDTPTKAAA